MPVRKCRNALDMRAQAAITARVRDIQARAARPEKGRYTRPASPWTVPDSQGTGLTEGREFQEAGRENGPGTQAKVKEPGRQPEIWALAALADEPGYAQINTADAERLGIEDEALVWVNSRKGRIITRAQVSDRPNKGAVYMTYQWWIGACNELVSENLSPITKTPEYKYCAVNVERIADQRAAEQYVIDEYNKLKARLRESAMG